MCSRPLISVIIPVYNGEKYLKEAIMSVTNQDCKDLEIIIVNDGSSDNSLKIAEALASEDSRIRVISKENGGVSVARNVGIDAAKGEYISFLDADDLWDKKFFSLETVTFIKDNETSDIFGFNSDCFDTDFNILDTYRVYDWVINGGKDKAVDTFYWIHFSSFLYKLDFLNKYNIRFPQGVKYSEDEYFRATCLYYSELVTCKDIIIFNYRYSPDSVTRGKGDNKEYARQKLNAYCLLKSFLYERYKEEGRDQKIHSTAVAQMFALSIDYWCQVGMDYKQLIDICSKESLIEDAKNNSYDFKIDDTTKSVLADFTKNTRMYYIKKRIYGIYYNIGKRIKGLIVK